MSVRILSLCALVALVGQASAQYTVRDLGALPSGSTSHGYKINDSGLVAGFSMTPQGARGFVWSPTLGMTNLGALRNDPSSFATAINNAGRVVGYSGAGGVQTSFVWDQSTGLTDLGTYGSDTFSLALDLNDQGQVVGTSGNNSGARRAFLYQSSTGMIDLGPVPGRTTSFARGINSHSQVVGHSAGSNTLAFLWQSGTMSALQNLAGGTSEAYEINDAGKTVGWSMDAQGKSRAVVWSGAGFAPVVLDSNLSGSQGTMAFDINETGQAVGYGVFNGQDRAVVFDPILGATKLEALVGPASFNWTFLRAQGINEHGEIVGYGLINGTTHAFVATPVPEPASLVGVAVAFVALMKRRRRKTA